MNLVRLGSIASLSDEPLTDTALRRQAAVLRKRFERIKERLRVLAKEAGLLSDS